MERNQFIRGIGRWDFTAAVINGVIGSRIFGVPAVLAGLTGALSPFAALVGFGVGWLLVWTRLLVADPDWTQS